MQERADVEWKFARSKLWISYFEEGGTAPPPFNVLPSPKSALYAWRWLQRRLCGHARAKREHMRTIRVHHTLLSLCRPPPVPTATHHLAHVCVYFIIP